VSSAVRNAATPQNAGFLLQYEIKYRPSLKAARPADGFLLLFDQGNRAARKVPFREPIKNAAFGKAGVLLARVVAITKNR
jgi:hypothetical protein